MRLDPTKLSKSLNGARRFSSLDLTRIAERCATSVDWLLTGVEPELALAARTTGGSAARAVDEALRLADLRKDMAFLGFAQPWQPLTVNSSLSWAEQGYQLAVAGS